MSCLACDASEWAPLPGMPGQAMVSDGQIVERGLFRLSCLGCGLACHEAPPGAEELRRLFASGYGLYAHPPGGERESRRQDAYASWIAAEAGAPPRRVIELGSGNGSLLRELARHWPDADRAGLEPSPEAAAAARAAGLDVRCGFAEESFDSDRPRDLVISVNVVEHARDPIAFLAATRARLAPGGTAVVVCPDGERPSFELLFFDHLHSFSREAFARVAARAGLRVRRSATAPEALGPFRMFLADAAAAEPAPANGTQSRALAVGRTSYLTAWAGLDAALVERAGSARALTCFGAGEAAFLLRAYAPRTWARVARIAIDNPTLSSFAGLPVEPVRGPAGPPAEPVLLAVRPQDQAVVGRRLEAGGVRVIRWDDILAR